MTAKAAKATAAPENGKPDELEAIREQTVYDPETGERIEPPQKTLARMWGIEFVAVEQFGERDARWRVSVKHPRNGEVGQLGPWPTKQFFTLTNLQEAILEFADHSVKAYRRNSADWMEFSRALKAAATLRPHGADSFSRWRRWLLAFADGHGAPLRGGDDWKRALLSRDQECAIDRRDDSLWVHRDSFCRHVEQAYRLREPDADVAAALPALGFRSEKVQARIGDDGRVKVRHYWHSPAGFMDGEEADDA